MSGDSNRPSPTAVIVRQGRLLDFIDGETQRKETIWNW